MNPSTSQTTTQVTPNGALRRRADNDVTNRANTILGKKDESVEPELERIRESLIEHRNNRDTTNLPEVERASSNVKVEAIRRRMKAKRDFNGDSKGRKSGNAATKNSPIADSGTPDSVAGSGGGDSGGGDSGGGGD